MAFDGLADRDPPRIAVASANAAPAKPGFEMFVRVSSPRGVTRNPRYSVKKEGRRHGAEGVGI